MIVSLYIINNHQFFLAADQEGLQMLAFLSTLTTVALAELGDKTQFIVLIFVSRFKRPMPILMAVITASFISELLAGAIGIGLRSYIKPKYFEVGRKFFIFTRSGLDIMAGEKRL